MEDEDYTYAYDEKGNRISKTAKVSGAVETYTYDSQNRLMGYASPTVTASYAYDARERRIAKTVDGTGTAYVYDMSPTDPLAMDDITLEFEAGTIPTLKRRWAHSNAVDEPVGFEEYNASGPAGSGTERLIYADRQGSISRITDPVSNDVVAAYEYGSFGQVTQIQGMLSQPYNYTGREYDAELGYHYFRAGYFDQASGIFLNLDPNYFDAGDLNIYRYGFNNPTNFSDPSGMFVAVENEFVGSLAKDLGKVAVLGVVTGSILPLTNELTLALRDATKIHSAPGTRIRVDTNDFPPPGNCKPKDYGKFNKEKIVLTTC